jgi:signal transduction histidine kinase
MGWTDDRSAVGSRVLEADREDRGSASRPRRGESWRVKVLLVEDSPGDARLVRTMLAEADAEEFELTHAERLSDAVQQLRKNPFDVVLLDLRLPDSAGIDSLVRMQAVAPYLPIVVLTGLDDDAVALQTLQSGAEDYLIKGQWDANQLARAIRYAIGRKHAQEQLANRETLLALGDFASGVAHNLRNLFMAIRGRLSLLLEGRGRAEIQSGLRIVLEATDRGIEVVRRLQAFTRAEPLTEAGRVDLNEVVEHVLELTRPCWEDDAQRPGPIETVLERGQLPPLLGDSFGLHEALLSLVFNAIEAMPKGGRITIKSWASDGWVHCSVSDTGTGMSPEVRRRAVEPFFTTKGWNGTGLGLSIVYGIVKRHLGKLNLQSAEGQGTSVTLSLPLRRS